MTTPTPELKPNDCVECGGEALCQPPLFTTLNKVGPLCIGCYSEMEDEEQLDAGQFGVGA